MSNERVIVTSKSSSLNGLVLNLTSQKEVEMKGINNLSKEVYLNVYSQRSISFNT